MEYNWTVIENINNWVFPIKTLHPDSPQYINYWKDQIKKCIEGHWAFDNGGWRYMSGPLFFTVNHGSIILTDEKEKTRRIGRPNLTDLFWEFSYLSLVASGFSGFKEDDEFSCDERLLHINSISDIDISENLDIISKDGKLKKYEKPLEYVKRLHSEPFATPLYWNNCKNYMIMGSRSGGKSFWVALGELLHTVLFDGIKYYTDENRLNPPKVKVLVGSGDSQKSSDLCNKVADAMNQLAISNELGIWSTIGESDYCPSPLFKNMVGELLPNNKENYYRHEYKMDYGGGYVTKGTGSGIDHAVYSENKRAGKGAQAGAGGRYAKAVIEEGGLTSMLLEVFRSNDAVVQTDGIQFGSQIIICTSENITLVQPAKEIFTHPKDYKMVYIDDVWERTGDIGFFLPAYMTSLKFKDKNGNTNIELAKKHFEKIREEKAKSNNPDLLRGEKLNYPMIPSEMWLGTKAKILPYEEAAEREKSLMKNLLYEKIGTPVTLTWASSYPNGVKHEVNYSAKPIYNYPIRVDSDNVEGAIMIYSFPEEETGMVPNDKYLAICDTYVSEALDAGGSLGVTFVVLHPKYWHKMPPTGPIVASYIGKNAQGLDGHLENQEKLLAFYGNPLHGLWLEKNRIERYRDHYIKKKKPWILAPTPTKFLSKSAYERVAVEYGIPVSNKVMKLQFLDMLHDLLLQEITVMGTKKRFIETIPCIYTIREIMAYDVENGNFDAVSALLMLPVVIEQIEYTLEQTIKQKNNKNPLSFLSMNSKIYKEEDYRKITQNKKIELMQKGLI